MEMRSACLLLLLIATSMFFSTLLAANAADEAALLAFKAAAIGSNSNALTSWNGSTDGGYSSWEGVRCRGRHRRVVALSLPSHGLTGVLSPAVGNLSSLRILNLNHNGFSGNIPESLGRLGHPPYPQLDSKCFLWATPRQPELLHQPNDHGPPLEPAQRMRSF